MRRSLHASLLAKEAAGIDGIFSEFCKKEPTAKIAQKLSKDQ